MKTFKDTFDAIKRRIGDNTDPLPEKVAEDLLVEKLARDTGLTKEAIAGLLAPVLRFATAPVRWGARKGLQAAAALGEGAVGQFMKAPIMHGFIGYQALGEAKNLNRLMKPRFPRPPRGVGLHD